MTALQQVTASDQTLARLNENFTSVSPAGLYAKRPATTSGLTLGYYGGYFGGILIADGTVVLPASEAAVYVVADRSDGAVTQSTGTTNWNNSTDYFRIGVAITGSTTITSWEDFREAFAAPVSSGGGAVDSVNGQTGVVVLDTDDVSEAANKYFTDERVDDRVAALLVAGSNITLTYDDGAGSLTIDATGGGGGAADFTDLGDVPASYTGSALKAVRVNAGETALEFYAPSAGSSGVNLQTGSTYTLVLGDASVQEVQRSNAAANTTTVPPSSSVSFAVGAEIAIRMLGSGTSTIVAGSGVTVNSLQTLDLLATGAIAVLRQVDTDVWWLTGELKPQVPTYKSDQRYTPANATTAGVLLGMVITSTATVSHPAQALTNLLTATRRTRWSTSASAGNASGFFETTATKTRGNGAGLGGFNVAFRFGASSNVTGHQAFVGLGSAAALAGDPSALTNMIGVGYDAADASTGNWQLMRNDGSGTATRVDLGSGAARNTTDQFLLTIRAPSNGSLIYVTLLNEATATVVLDTSYNTDLPANNAFMALRCQVRNGAIASACSIDLADITVGYQE